MASVLQFLGMNSFVCCESWCWLVVDFSHALQFWSTSSFNRNLFPGETTCPGFILGDATDFSRVLSCFVFTSQFFGDTTNWEALHQFIKLPALCWEKPSAPTPFQSQCAILKLHSDLIPAGLYSIWYHCKTFSFMPAQYSDFALPLCFWGPGISLSYSELDYVGFFMCICSLFNLPMCLEQEDKHFHQFSSL